MTRDREPYCQLNILSVKMCQTCLHKLHEYVATDFTSAIDIKVSLRKKIISPVAIKEAFRGNY